MDVSHLKCLIVDEADEFFKDDKNFTSMKKVRNAINNQNKNRQPDNRIQNILFSATYPKGETDLIHQRFKDYGIDEA